MQNSTRTQATSAILPINKNPKSQESQQNQSLSAIFQMDYHLQIFLSRCQDTGQKPDVEKAKMFRQSFNKINSKKYPNVLNLYSMRLGVNTIMKLMSILDHNRFSVLNLADNSISEYGMHAVKNLIGSTSIESLNLASNMISEVGLSLVLDDLIRNNKLKSLDIGISEGSIRKNSIGIDGARCIAAVLLQNKTLQCLKLQDNDIGINGAQIISIPLKKNKVLKELKIAQNLIKSQGAQYILSNALFLQSLDLGKNFIKSSLGVSLKRYLETNLNLKKLNLELNEIAAEGCKVLFEGVVKSKIIELNLRGNGLTDRGIIYISDILTKNGSILETLSILDLSSNEITLDSMKDLLNILQYVQIKSLNLSKNSLGDEGVTQLAGGIKNTITGQYIERLEFGGCKVSDKGFVKMLEELNYLPQLKHLKFNENYISERYEKIYIQLLDKNHTVISLNLNGNRLSLSGFKGLKRIVERNLKLFEQKQPKKIKTEIYNMKQKQRKIRQAQERLDKQKRQILRLQQQKLKLHENVSRIQREEKDKKFQYQEIIKKKMEQLEKLDLDYDQKVAELQKTKNNQGEILQKMNKELQNLRNHRKQLQYQLKVVQDQGDSIEKEFQNKIKFLQ